MANFLKYKHTRVDVETVGEFINSKDNLVGSMNAIDLLLFEDNLENFFRAFSASDKAKYQEQITILERGTILTQKEEAARALPLKVGTVFKIPKDKNKQELVYLYGKNQFLESKPFVGAWSSNLAQLLTDEQYVPIENLAKDGRNLNLSVNIINQNIKIWIYCKALGRVINLSPFISSCITRKDEIGYFDLTIDPIVSPDELISSGRDFINLFPINNFTQHTLDYFSRYIQMNDIVFIRYEKLLIEGNERTENEEPFFINKNQLVNQVWDMIGLVDMCSGTYNSGSTVNEVSVGGRDLTKLLIEDASYLMPLRYIEGGSKKFFYTGNPDDSFFKRNYIRDGAYDYLFFYGFRNIRSTLGFIINHLSNLGVIGDENLFSSYVDENGNDRRSRVYAVDGANEYVTSNLVNGIWQIIKLQLDPIVQERVISDPSFAFVDGSLIEQFNKICQKPFVEFLPDTYGDVFSFFVRQPPFTKEAIVSFIDGTYSIETPTDEVIGGGGIELQVVRNKKLADLGINSSVIDIEESNTSGYGLEWEQTYYTSYQIQAQNTILGQDTYVMLNYIPIVYFEEYAQFFGNHRKVISDNYLKLSTLSGDDQKVNLGNFKRALLSDLKYVMDSNVYLPFTRRGSITLTTGDRRIKRGTFVRFKATGEIFYVDSVSNNVSFSKERVERQTILSVSRGMIEEYIKGSIGYEDNGSIITEGGKPKVFSYFNIVDTQLIYDEIYAQTEEPILVTGEQRETQNIKTTTFEDKSLSSLDKTVFDFFLKRKQFNLKNNS